MERKPIGSDDLKKAYPPVPDGYEQNVCSTLLRLTEKKEGPIMKKKVSMGLIAALVLLALLAGAALAASQLGLFDYLQGSYKMAVPADAKEAMEQNPLTQTYDMGAVTVAFHEVIADGHWFYFTALVTPKDPAKMWIVPDGGGVVEPAHMYDTNWDRKDMRTCTELAREENRQLVFMDIDVEFNATSEVMFDNSRQPDGTLLYITGGGLEATAPTQEVTVRLHTYLMEPEGTMVKGSDMEQLIPLTVTIAPATEERVYPGEGKALGDTKVIVDKVTLTKTALAVYEHVDYHMEDGTKEPAEWYIDYLDEVGRPLGLGTTCSSGSVNMKELPEEVTLQAFIYDTGKRSAPLTLKAEGK